MTPRSAAERHLRDGALRLAGRHDFARRLVNSGRLSTPCSLEGLSLQTADGETDGLAPGAPCLDAPLENGWLLNALGDGFTLLTVGDAGAANGLPVRAVPATDEVVARYGDGLTYLVRPDQHVAARWRNPSAEAIAAAHKRALGHA